MRTTLRDTLRRVACVLALAGLAGVAVGWTPAAAQPGPGGQQAEAYKGTLEPLAESGVEGTVNLQRKGERLSVELVARNLTSGTHPQHLHDGESCSDFGGVAVPLDSDLGSSEAGDFPSTEGESATLTYSGKGSDAMFTELDLENMTVVVHAPDGTPVACAELERKGGGSGG